MSVMSAIIITENCSSSCGGYNGGSMFIYVRTLDTSLYSSFSFAPVSLSFPPALFRYCWEYSHEDIGNNRRQTFQSRFLTPWCTARLWIETGRVVVRYGKRPQWESKEIIMYIRIYSYIYIKGRVSWVYREKRWRKRVKLPGNRLIFMIWR